MLYFRIALVVVSLHFIEFAEESIVNRLGVGGSVFIGKHNNSSGTRKWTSLPSASPILQGTFECWLEQNFKSGKWFSRCCPNIHDYCGPHVLLLIDLQIFKRSADPGIDSLELSVRWDAPVIVRRDFKLTMVTKISLPFEMLRRNYLNSLQANNRAQKKHQVY